MSNNIFDVRGITNTYPTINRLVNVATQTLRTVKIGLPSTVRLVALLQMLTIMQPGTSAGGQVL